MSPAYAHAELNEDYDYLGRIWKREPLVWAEDVLGLKNGICPRGTWTEDQVKLWDSYLNNKYTACTSGNSTGKTFALAAIFLHFITTEEDSIAVTTSASWELLEDTLWPEIRRMYRGAKIPIGGDLTLFRLEMDDKWFGYALSTEDATKFQGKHARRVLLILDEATGISEEIFKGGDSMVSGPDDRVIATANPTDGTCYYAQEVMDADKAIRKGEYTRWNRVVIDAENHPNVKHRRVLIPGAVTYEKVEEYERKYGREHPEFLARVKGIYSETSGRLFPDWSEERHTYKPKAVRIEPWWPHWIVIDWGFAHNAAVLFMAWSGTKLYVYDEIVINNLTAAALAEKIGQRANPVVHRGLTQQYEGVYLSHDAFSKQGETSRSRAEIMSEVFEMFGLPVAQRAAIDRVGGFNLITSMLRSDTLLVSEECRGLIEKMPLAMREVKKGIVTEDGKKFTGDDEIDALYKGVLVRGGEPEIPKELIRQQQITATDPQSRAMHARILAAQDRQGDQGIFLMRGRRYGTGGN